MRQLLACLILLLAMGGRAYAEATPAPGQAIEHKLHSTILGEERTIHVYLPAGYKAESADKYDVVYVLDGEMLVRFFPPVRAFAEENDLIPPLIIVGINNLYWYDKGLDSRDRDLLPTHVAGSPLSGGADRFAHFLVEELKPYIDRTYATSGRTTLFGHSYGGMFTTYMLLLYPNAFDHYIVSDPALWWNDGYVDRLATTKLGALPPNKTLFIGGRTGRINQAFGIARMVALLRAKAPRGLRWKNVANADEDHGSVRLKNIYDGLKFTYFGHGGSMIDVFPTDGILLKGKPVALLNYSSFLTEQPGIRYTTDGAEPTARSARYDYGLPISAPARLTVKQFSNWGPDKTVKGRFVLGEALAPVRLPAGFTAGGVHYKRYDTAPPELSELDRLTASSSGRLDGFSLGAMAGPGPFAARLTSHFYAHADGYYIFLLDCDAAAELSIDGRLLIAIDAARDGRNQRSFVLPLKHGFHSLAVDYWHRSGERRLSLTYLAPTRPGDPLAHLPIEIPSELLYAAPDS
jgi:predicted alpha/beta superfamily hydrolase